jgi:hypothetical protein
VNDALSPLAQPPRPHCRIISVPGLVRDATRVDTPNHDEPLTVMGSTRAVDNGLPVTPDGAVTTYFSG